MKNAALAKCQGGVLILECVSKIPNMHFRHLELHFSVDFP